MNAKRPSNPVPYYPKTQAQAETRRSIQRTTLSDAGRRMRARRNRMHVQYWRWDGRRGAQATLTA